MPQLEADTVTLDNIRERLTPELLDAMFANTNLLDDVTGRAAYLRKAIRESDAANANFKHMVNTCAAAGHRHRTPRRLQNGSRPGPAHRGRPGRD
jgi:hypothetical protein